MAVKIGGEAQPKVKKVPKPAKASGPVKTQPPARPSASARQRFLASYHPLVRKFPLEPIRDDAHLNQALAVVEKLLKRYLDEGANSYLHVLTGLIEAHESKSFPLPDASEANVLRELMRLNGLSQPALEAKVGIAQPTISAVLRGTRRLTKDQVIALARVFHVSPEAFLRAT